MNVLIHEWYNMDCHFFVFDTSKVNLNIPFEKSYYDAINLALKRKNNSIEYRRIQHLPDIDQRFKSYTNHDACWRNLLINTKLYQVDAEITFYMTQ